MTGHACHIVCLPDSEVTANGPSSKLGEIMTDRILRIDLIFIRNHPSCRDQEERNSVLLILSQDHVYDDQDYSPAVKGIMRPPCRLNPNLIYHSALLKHASTLRLLILRHLGIKCHSMRRDVLICNQE